MPHSKRRRGDFVDLSSEHGERTVELRCRILAIAQQRAAIWYQQPQTAILACPGAMFELRD